MGGGGQAWCGVTGFFDVGGGLGAVGGSLVAVCVLSVVVMRVGMPTCGMCNILPHQACGDLGLHQSSTWHHQARSAPGTWRHTQLRLSHGLPSPPAHHRCSRLTQNYYRLDRARDLLLLGGSRGPTIRSASVSPPRNRPLSSPPARPAVARSPGGSFSTYSPYGAIHSSVDYSISKIRQAVMSPGRGRAVETERLVISGACLLRCRVLTVHDTLRPSQRHAAD